MRRQQLVDCSRDTICTSPTVLANKKDVLQTGGRLFPFLDDLSNARLYSAPGGVTLMGHCRRTACHGRGSARGFPCFETTCRVHLDKSDSSRPLAGNNRRRLQSLGKHHANRHQSDLDMHTKTSNVFDHFSMRSLRNSDSRRYIERV